MQQMLNKAIVLAATHHDGQFDKSGLPYILHVMKVMHYLKSNDEELNCIAVLHDIIEDTSCTFQAMCIMHIVSNEKQRVLNLMFLLNLMA